MLILSRGLGEGIVVDGPCRVVLSEIRGNQVRLGFEADPSVRIYRDEVLEQIQQQEVNDDGRKLP